MGLAVHPHTIVTIAHLVEHGAPAFLLIILPVACVLSAQLVLRIANPESPLPMLFVVTPPSFVLVPILEVLNTKPVFLIVLPLAYVLIGPNPFVRFLRPIFV